MHLWGGIVITKKSKSIKKYNQEKDLQVLKSKRITSIKNLICKGMISKAYSEIENYLSDYPSDSYGLYQRAVINGMLGNIEEEKRDLEYIIENGLNSRYSARYKLANIYFSEGDIKRSEKLLIENIEISPYPEVYSIITLSNIKLLQGEKQAALDVLYKYSQMDDDELVLQEIVIKNKIGYTKEAYDKLMNYEFSNNDVVMTKYYNVRANLALVLGNYDEAKECYQECFNLMNSIQRDKIEIDYASGCYTWGDHEKARQICLKTLYSSNSDYKEKASLILGNIAKLNGNYDEARSYYLDAAQYQKNKTYRGYLLVGQLYGMEDNYEEASKYYNLVIDSSVNKQIVNQAYLRLAFLEYRRNNIAAVKKYDSLINRKYISVLDASDYAFIKIVLDSEKDVHNIEEKYTYSQYINYDYSYETLLNHISKVHEGNGQTSFFSPEIDLSSLVLESAEMIKKQKPSVNYTMDIYRINYDNVGYVNNRLVNQCEIVVVPNTDKIITIYPCYYADPVNKCESKKGIQKQKSRIDKFNQKYGNKK